MDQPIMLITNCLPGAGMRRFNLGKTFLTRIMTLRGLGNQCGGDNTSNFSPILTQIVTYTRQGPITRNIPDENTFVMLCISPETIKKSLSLHSLVCVLYPAYPPGTELDAIAFTSFARIVRYSDGKELQAKVPGARPWVDLKGYDSGMKQAYL